jgi:ribosomal protein S18 acetylase RimI-like enzyme
MTKTLQLRSATLSDAHIITEVYIASRKAFIPFAPLAHSDESIYQWISTILIPANQVTVAVINDAIIGMMATSQKEGIGWIDQLYISPCSVGHGAGSQLLTFAKSKLGSPIRLHTFQENFDARRFYERHGFKILEFSDGAANEEKCPDILYEWIKPIESI